MPKSIPKPPPRRPNIAERISMLQMAQTRHTGFKPEGGVPLVLPEVPAMCMRKAVKRVDDESMMTKGGANRKEKIRGLFRRHRGPPKSIAITVTLLDESEW